MPIRGAKSPFPKKAQSPTGILSTRGAQKKDAQAKTGSKEKAVQAYALSGGGEIAGKPTGSVNKSLRHLPPRKR